MDGGERISSGFRNLVSAIASNLAAIFASRLELFSTEVAEEGHRLVQMLIWAALGIFSGFMAFVLINILLVYLFWEEARLTVLIVLALFYTLLLLAIIFGFARSWKARKPFSATIHEFQKDYECFRRKS